MKIGFDIRAIIKKEQDIHAIEKTGIRYNQKIFDERILSVFKTLEKRNHEVYLFFPVVIMPDMKVRIKTKKSIIRRLQKSEIDFVKVAVVPENDMEEVVQRNYIDLFVSSDEVMVKQISKVTDVFHYTPQKNIDELMDAILSIIDENRKAILNDKTCPQGLPSEDKLWMKYYRRGDFKWSQNNMSPYDRVIYSNQDWLDETAMEYFGKKCTYNKFFEEIEALAASLWNSGIHKGVKVPALVVNTPESIVMLYALYKVKATVVPIYPLSTKEDISEKLQDICNENRISGGKNLLFISNLVCGRFEEVIPKNYQVIVISVTDSMPKLQASIFEKILMPKMGIKKVKYDERFISFGDYAHNKVDNQTICDLDTSFDNSYPAVQLFTGGTIKPKGVMLSEANIDAASKQFYNDRFDFQRRDKMAAFMPLNHSFGLIIGTHVAISLGVDLDVIMKINFKRLDKIFIKDKCNLFGGIPNMFPAIRKNERLKSADLSHVKYVLSGGAQIDKTEKNETTKFFKDRNSNVEVHDGYGATESSGGIIYDGIPNMNTNVKIVEPGTTKELGYGKIGELCLSGPQIMIGYTDEGLTQLVLKKHTDRKIWLHTGDSALIHTNGKVEIIGRMDRMIKVNGEQVYLDKLEEEINTLYFVERSVVVKKKDTKRGLVPVAYIKLKSGYKWDDITQKAINDFYERRLTSFTRPRRTEIVEDFPLTDVGKIDFKKLERIE